MESGGRDGEERKDRKKLRGNELNAERQKLKRVTSR